MGIYYAGRPCYDPQKAYEYCVKRQIPPGTWWGLANRYITQRGAKPAEANLLMLRSDLELLDKTRPHDLTFSFDGISNQAINDTSVTIKNMWPIASEAIGPSTLGRNGDTLSNDTLYYVKMVDKRHLLRHVPIGKAFNIRKVPTGPFKTSTSFSASTGWTWAEVWQRIWEEAAPVLGVSTTAPALGRTPDGTPEGFDYYTANAQYAIDDFLTRCGCVLCYNPITDTYTTEGIGETQPNLAQRIQALKDQGRLVYLADPIVWDYGRYPANARCHFRKQPTAAAYTGNPYYTNEKPLSFAGSVAGTYVMMFDDLPAMYQGDTLENAAALGARRDDRITAYETAIKARDREKWTFSAATLSILPGSEIMSVEIRDRWSGKFGGMQTEVIRAVPVPDPYENWAGVPDQHYRLVEIVEITSATMISDHYEGVMKLYDTTTNSLVDQFNVWVKSIN